MFRLPTKEIIINDDSQMTVLEDDGTAYADNDIVANTSGGFILQGFLTETIWASLTALAANPKEGQNSYLNTLPDGGRMTATASSVGVAEITAYAIVAASGGKAGDTYRLVLDSLDITPTEYQNRPVEKRYQLGVDCANAVALVVELAAQINADPKSPVTAYVGFNNASPVQNDTDTLVLIAKQRGLKVSLHVGEFATLGQTTYTVVLTREAVGATVYHTVEDTTAVMANAALPIGTYEALKNINFAKNFHIDTNINWMPLPGAVYTTYYFEVVSTLKDNANSHNVNEVQSNRVYGVKVYVKTGLTAQTALGLIDGDVG